MAMTASDGIHLDYARAYKHADLFRDDSWRLLFAQALELISAMDQFVLFMGLPKSAEPPSFFLAIASAALVILPELAALKVIEDASKAAQLAAAIAKASDNTAKFAKSVKVATGALQKGGEFIEKRKIKDSIEAGQKLAESVRAEPEPPNPLDQLSDASTELAEKLIESSHLAGEAWNDATDALLLKYGQRLEFAGAEVQFDQSMEDWIKGVLKPLPKAYNKHELAQLQRKALWYLVGNYVRTSVRVVNSPTYTSRTYHGEPIRIRSGTESSLVGLNNTQIKTILEQFGGTAPRGSIFIQPPVFSIYAYLTYWGAQVVDA